MARRVLDRVYDRAVAEHPDWVRRWTQQTIYDLYRDAREGDEKAAALHREVAPRFRAEGYDVPLIPTAE